MESTKALEPNVLRKWFLVRTGHDKNDSVIHLPEAAEVQITIYNMVGQPVRTLVQGRKAAGAHTIRWDGANTAGAPVASGAYLVRLAAGEFVGCRKWRL